MIWWWLDDARRKLDTLVDKNGKIVNIQGFIFLYIVTILEMLNAIVNIGTFLLSMIIYVVVFIVEIAVASMGLWLTFLIFRIILKIIMYFKG